jgi:hypothetical protein
LGRRSKFANLKALLDGKKATWQLRPGSARPSKVSSGVVASLTRMWRGETAISTSHPLDAATVAALRSMATRFGGADHARKLALLRTAAGAALCDMGVLLAYHDVLLFVLAYPATAAMRSLASRELARVAAATREMEANGPARACAGLRGSGVAWSTITIAYSYPIARWLVSRYPRCAEVDSFGEGGALLAQWLRHALPSAEFELLESCQDTPEELLEVATTGWRRSRLAWLIAQFERLPCDPALREAAYDSLHLFVTLNPRDAPISRTFTRGLPAAPFYHRGPLLRDVDANQLIASPLPPARRLPRNACKQLVDAGRAVLAMLGRETDPITHADIARTRYYDLGRGVAIALFSASPRARDPLDSHIGYMLSKNSVPVGYGGGWPFLGTCKIGINIFAPFRGGESTFLMASVLRAYAQLFAVERFVVEPYQFGAGNREGLASGAFWFYFRLGFRPVESKLRAVANEEFEQMRRNPGHRTSLTVLRRFTRSDLERPVVPGARPACDPAALSRATTAWIGARFGGRRDRAEAVALSEVVAALGLEDYRGWNEDERHALRGLAPVLAQISDLHAWSARDKRRLAALVRAKGGDEYRYFALMADFAQLRSGLNALAENF